MKNRLQGLLKDRKILYLVLCIAVVSVFTLSIAYAAMSAVLEIHGNSEVVASSWDIHLENAEHLSECNIGSVTGPSISMDGNSVIFNVELNEPGECFGFTIDVVNDGSIDAMIDSVVKTPELTPEQAKYIKYDVSYENGESISTKQILKKGTRTPIKVKLEYRKDISVSDLPSHNTSLNLSLMFVYVQSDGSGSSIPNNGAEASLVRVVSGDGTQVGNEVCISEECFYVISSTTDTVTMLSKYNLHVGNSVDEDDNVTPLENPTGKQDQSARGWVEGATEWYGTTQFSDGLAFYSGSIVKGYVNAYKTIIEEDYGVPVVNAELIYHSQLERLGCSIDDDWSCSEAPDWVYATSYWSGPAYDEFTLLGVKSTAAVGFFYYRIDNSFGVRPVITISRDYL